MRIGNTYTNMMASSSSYHAYYSPPPLPFNAPRPSPWHSPVPYLFAGLAAMLGLIAFALLILACSYWKLSGYLEDDENDRNRESDELEEVAKIENGRVFDDTFLVIMAGEEKPTHLATPSNSRTSSFGSDKTAVVAVSGGGGSSMNGTQSANLGR